MKKVNFLYAPDAKGDNGGGAVASAPIGEKAKTDGAKTDNGATEPIAPPIITGQGPQSNNGVARVVVPENARPKTTTVEGIITEIGDVKMDSRDRPYHWVTITSNDGNTQSLRVNAKFMNHVSNRDKFVRNKRVIIMLDKTIEGVTQYIDKDSGTLITHTSTGEFVSGITYQGNDFAEKMGMVTGLLEGYKDDDKMFEAVTRIMTGQKLA